MEIRVLRYFLTVAQEESFSRAAALLHLTQPTLSRQIAQMEEELGVTLLNRGKRKIELTEEGILLRRRAEEIVTLVDKTERELIEQDRQVEGKITIGCGEMSAFGMVSELFVSFQRRYPGVSFDVFTANADLVKEQMDKGLLDIGLLIEPVDVDKYDFIRMPMKEEWVVLMRPDDPLADRMRVTAKDLIDRPLILPRRMNVQNEVVNWFGPEFEHLPVTFTSNLSTNGAVMVSKGLGRSIVIEGSLPFLDSTQIITRPLSPALSSTSVLAWKRHQPLGPAVRKLVEHMRCFLRIE